ncbi:unnamed protein product [Callosobruchus maculatus]|uniref:Odorant receptor n=1 Tax=Callosobruchus maculatus TaxID=64391 RepID=A0A653C0H2_CALMS|nr:unnamed protein product [Callosobruchus maculatus]
MDSKTIKMTAMNLKTKFRKCNGHHNFLLRDNLVDFMRLVTYTLLMYVELFVCFCYPSQELFDEANQLSISLYCNTNWYNHPSCYRNILILLGKSQRRVIFTACGLLDLDLQTGMSAIQSMISYSMFLRKVTGMDE